MPTQTLSQSEIDAIVAWWDGISVAVLTGQQFVDQAQTQTEILIMKQLAAQIGMTQ